jgi:O-antigen biosynthesis protein
VYSTESTKNGGKKKMQLGNGKKNFLIYKSASNKYQEDNNNATEDSVNYCLASFSKIIQPNSVVLDVGCAQGLMGKMLKDKPGCKVYGVDINEDALKYARASGYYEDVFKLNIENSTDSDEFVQFRNSTPHFDFIVLSNLLEHLVDPTSALLKLSGMLENRGNILISIPNLSHADISLNLLNGVFNYNDVGILDNTHLRFFTKQSFIQWIDQINGFSDQLNFECKYIGGIFYYSDYLTEIKNNQNYLYRLIEANPDFNVIQHDFVLTKQNLDEATPELSKLLNEPVIQTTALIDNALKGHIEKVDYPADREQNRLYSLCRGEREWMETVLHEKVKENSELIIKIDELSIVNKNNQEKINMLIENIQHLNEYLVSAEKTLDKFVTSMSWKITRPLRLFSEFIHKKIRP